RKRSRRISSLGNGSSLVHCTSRGQRTGILLQRVAGERSARARNRSLRQMGQRCSNHRHSFTVKWAFSQHSARANRKVGLRPNVTYFSSDTRWGRQSCLRTGFPAGPAARKGGLFCFFEPQPMTKITLARALAKLSDIVPSARANRKVGLRPAAFQNVNVVPNCTFRKFEVSRKSRILVGCPKSGDERFPTYPPGFRWLNKLFTSILKFSLNRFSVSPPDPDDPLPEDEFAEAGGFPKLHVRPRRAFTSHIPAPIR